MRIAQRLAGGLLLLVLIACQAGAAPPRVGFYKLDSQRLSGATGVSSTHAAPTDLSVIVTIDTQGHVIDAEAAYVVGGMDPKPGLAAVRQWTFRPQTFEGRPVVAVGMVSISYHVPEIAANPAIPFPADDGANTEITLERGACFGTCPDYRVTVTGDGTVRFTTSRDHFAGTAAEVHQDYNGNNVLLPGDHVAHIDPGAVKRLLDQFRAARFFGLKNVYFASITDSSTQRLTLRVGGKSKVVTDYVGTMVGMPQAVRDLEEAVDSVTGTARWVDGDADTLAWLDEQHFDFRSPAALKLAAAVAWHLNDYGAPTHSDALILGLVERGVPLDGRIGDATLGQMLVGAAARGGKEALFARLVAAGQLAAMKQGALSEAFQQVGCSPAIAQALVKAGADPHAVGGDGSALNALSGSVPACGEDEARTLAMATTLIGLGVPLEARNNLGWTVLMGCDSPALAALLLAHGANPNARSKDMTALLSTDDDRVALLLLRAGADPHARNDRGSLREQAIKGHMPATLAWLDAHGVP